MEYEKQETKRFRLVRHETSAGWLFGEVCWIPGIQHGRKSVAPMAKKKKKSSQKV